ncbi:MAG: SdpI family protein [Hyphomicrobiales bacterium]
MGHIEYEKGKKQIRTLHIIALVLMVAISFIAYPYVEESLVKTIERGKHSISEAKFVQYLTLLAMPSLPFMVVLCSLFLKVSEKEKIAQAKNLPRFIPINLFLVIILVIAHMGMQLFVTLPKAIFAEYADIMLTAVFVLLSFMMLWMANILAKNTKSLWSGFPTPWNQKSELAWEKSQRFIGFSLATISLASLMMAFIAPLSVPFIMGIGLCLSYVGCFIVSYYVYKTELALKGESNKADG